MYFANFNRSHKALTCGHIYVDYTDLLQPKPEIKAKVRDVYPAMAVLIINDTVWPEVTFNI